MRDAGRIGPIEWAVASSSHPGERVCGDHWVAVDTGRGAALFAVIDGLGHGAAAASASHRAAAVITDNPAEPIDVLLLLCHRALIDTRGAAMSLAVIDFGDRHLEWIGVGNVCSSLVAVVPGGPTAPVSALLRGGIVGYRLPTLPTTPTTPMATGDLLVMASDGIAGNHLHAADPSKSAAANADTMLANYATETDDALILIARRLRPTTTVASS